MKSPGAYPAPASMNSPGAYPAPASMNSPGAYPAPASMNSPGAYPAPASMNSPGAYPAPASMNSPGAYARRGHALLLLALVALAASGCRTARREDAVGILPYYKGAEVVSAGEFQGDAYGFGGARWTRTVLTARAPYEQVRDFYATIRPSGWTTALTNETRKDSGRRYDRYLADAQRREFYVIQLREEQGGVVLITLARGLASRDK